jgi:hypothetical protein
VLFGLRNDVWATHDEQHANTQVGASPTNNQSRTSRNRQSSNSGWSSLYLLFFSLFFFLSVACFVFLSRALVFCVFCWLTLFSFFSVGESSFSQSLWHSRRPPRAFDNNDDDGAHTHTHEHGQLRLFLDDGRRAHRRV